MGRLFEPVERQGGLNSLTTAFTLKGSGAQVAPFAVLTRAQIYVLISST